MSSNQNDPNPTQPSDSSGKTTESGTDRNLGGPAVGSSHANDARIPAESAAPEPGPTAEMPTPGNPKDTRQVVRDAKKKTGPGGDVNVANIGEGAQVDQIAVGRNILQAKVNIGSLVIPVRFLLALLVVAAIGAVVVWWIVVPGQMPSNTGSANIAVVEFAEQDEAGNSINTSDGAKLSQWLYDRLNTELGNSPQGTPPTAWHIATSLDPIHLFQKRFTAGPVRNNDDAKRVAEQVGATIVIYGTVTSGDDSLTLEPQFFVVDDPKSQETPELVGSQQMGSPISLSRPVSIGAFESDVKPLGRIVYWLTRGLTFDLVGNFRAAYDEFLKGEPEVAKYEDNRGKEVFYYFMGTEALFLAQCEKDASDSFHPPPGQSGIELALNAAEHAYNLARDANRNYARAYFGLGQVASQRGQRLMYAPDAPTYGQCRVTGIASGETNPSIECPAPPPATDDPARLEQARTELMKALDFDMQALQKMETSKDVLLRQRLQTMKAITELPLAQAFLLGGNIADAETHIQTGLDGLNALTATTDEKVDPRGVALLNFGLGSGYFLQGYTRLIQNDPDGFKKLLGQADGGLQACINIATEKKNSSDKYLRERLAPNCRCLQIDAKKALTQ